MATLFSDFLRALGVKHTRAYSDARFAQMPFRTLYGLRSLLAEYGVEAEAVRVPDEEKLPALRQLPSPCLLQTPKGFFIYVGSSGGVCEYIWQGKRCAMRDDELAAKWTGVALLAGVDSESREPDYGKHLLQSVASVVKKVALVALLAGLLVWGLVASGLDANVWAWAVAAVDCAGLWLSVLLVQKSLGFKSAAADAVCSVVQAGGCDELAKSDASSFFGIVRWSEVGAAYFGVSLAALLMFPSTLPALAAINILCLPYTVWSVTYQKFKAKVWCALCLGVQASLWLLFAAYLAGGFTAIVNLSSAEFYIQIVTLGAAYAAALLALNASDDAIIHHLNTRPDDTPTHP